MTIEVKKITKAFPNDPDDKSYYMELKITTNEGETYVVNLPTTRVSLLSN